MIVRGSALTTIAQAPLPLSTHHPCVPDQDPVSDNLGEGSPHGDTDEDGADDRQERHGSRQLRREPDLRYLSVLVALQLRPIPGRRGGGGGAEKVTWWGLSVFEAARFCVALSSSFSPRQQQRAAARTDAVNS